MTTLKIVTIAAGLLVGGTSLAMAQYGGWYPGYGYGYGYAAAPLYDYAAPAYGLRGSSCGTGPGRNDHYYRDAWFGLPSASGGVRVL